MLSDFNLEMQELETYAEKASRRKVESLKDVIKIHKMIRALEIADEIRQCEENAIKQEKWVMENNKKMSRRLPYRRQGNLFEERK